MCFISSNWYYLMREDLISPLVEFFTKLKNKLSNHMTWIYMCLFCLKNTVKFGLIDRDLTLQYLLNEFFFVYEFVHLWHIIVSIWYIFVSSAILLTF